MPLYRYSVRDQEGNLTQSTMTADSEAAVVAELRKRDLIIVSIREESVVQARGPVKKSQVKGKKIKSEDIVVFTRQFATMVDAGIPILQVLDTLSEQASNPRFQQIIRAICEDIQLGNSLSGAFAKHGKIFDELYINMLKVGETGGVLSAVLDRVAMYLEKTERLKNKVRSALIYPAVIVSMAMLITVVLIVKVVPTFATIYDSLGQKLPLMTQMLIDLSNFMQKQLLLIVAVIVALTFGLMKYYKTPKGRLYLDTLMLRTPVFGDLICKVAVSRFSRTFSTLLQSGVSILEILDIVAKTCGNRVIELLVDDIKTSVREGESIAVPLSKNPYFPAMVTKMIAVGEQSGQLEKMLSKAAEFYDEQVDVAVESLTKLIEPLIIAFLGIVIGFIVVALFMPILSLTTALG